MTRFPLDEKFMAALETAHTWHTGQFRKSGPGEEETIPYISHLLGVASIALEFGATQDEAIAALLHDALEDGPQNLEPEVEKRGEKKEELRQLITERFGPEVARLVSGATEETKLIGGRKAPWAQRKGEYLAKLVDTEHVQDRSSLLVSASDKLHNARTILSDVITAGGEAGRTAFFQRFKVGQEGTLQYYRLLVRAYQAAPGSQGQPSLIALISELDRTVSALEAACGVQEQDVLSYETLRREAPARLF